MKFWIIVILEIEKLCLEIIACWIEFLRIGDVKLFFGELKVRSGNKCFKKSKKKYG